jgi:hypothetical protein
MARVDDYQKARDLAAADLAAEPLKAIAHRSGLVTLAPDILQVPFLGRDFQITHPGCSFADTADPAAPIPLQEQVLILHYLQRSQPRLSGRWIAYREIPGAGFYFGAFVKRAVEPLKKVFGSNAQAFQKAAAKLSGKPIETGSAGFEFKVLPFAPLRMILWEGDDEFPPEANILFDDSVGGYLSPEDAAWLASLTVYRLMGLSR